MKKGKNNKKEGQNKINKTRMFSLKGLIQKKEKTQTWFFFQNEREENNKNKSKSK